MCCYSQCLHDDQTDDSEYYTMKLLSSDTCRLFTIFILLDWILDADSFPEARERGDADGNASGGKRTRNAESGAVEGSARRACRPVPRGVLWQRLAPFADEAIMSLSDPSLRGARPPKGRRNRKRHRRHSGSAASEWGDDAGESHTYRLGGRRLLSHHPRHNSTLAAALSRSHSKHDQLRSLRGLKLRGENAVSGGVGAGAAARAKRTERHGSRRHGSKRPPLPWQCELHTYALKMKAGIFPPYIQTGRCDQNNVKDTCMMGMFECKPKKYVIKVLRRVPNTCAPVPSIGSDTVYEEVWKFKKMKVTVACECSGRRKNLSAVDIELYRALGEEALKL